MIDKSKHPVSKVQWVEADKLQSNDYNPNNVAKKEMELLQESIEADGFTQPIVCWEVKNDRFEVVDGFHRHLVGKERLGMSHLPIVVVNDDRTDKPDRMASTIRHNRARGKHKVGDMSEIVVELSKRNWSDKKIAKELGMDQDEVLRLKQISGIAELFEDEEFSKAWVPENE